LAVHPRFGQEALILKPRGADAVWAEFADGIVRELPLSWTDRRPRPLPLESGVVVRLAPDAVRALADWVAARVAALETCPPPAGVINSGKDAIARDSRGRPTAVAVVGKARAPNARGRGRGRGGAARRGKR
jgi:hypothetical protein